MWTAGAAHDERRRFLMGRAKGIRPVRGLSQLVANGGIQRSHRKSSQPPGSAEEPKASLQSSTGFRHRPVLGPQLPKALPFPSNRVTRGLSLLVTMTQGSVLAPREARADRNDIPSILGATNAAVSNICRNLTKNANYRTNVPWSPS